MANPALMVLPLDGSLQGRDRSGVFSAIGAGAVRYRPAPGARVNYAKNGSFESDGGWIGASRSGATISRSTEQSYLGTASLKIISVIGSSDSGVNGLGELTSGMFRIGQTYTLSFYMYSTVPVQLFFGLEEKMYGGSYLTGSYSSKTHTGGGWEQFSITRTLANAAVGRLSGMLAIQSTDGRTVYMDALQIEPGSVATPYIGSGAWFDPITGVLGNSHEVPRVERSMALIEAGSSNLVTNPWRNSNNTGWSAVNGSTARSTTYGYQGSASGSLTATAADAEERISITAAASAHMASAIVLNTTNASRQCQLVYNGSLIGSPVSVPAKSIATVSADFTGTGGAANLGIRWLDSASTEVFVTLYMGAEPSSLASSPIPAVDLSGTIASGYAWTSTAHASTATRTAATISMDEAGRIDPVSGSLAFRYVRDIDTGAAEPILDVGEGTSGKDRLRVRINASDKLEVSWQSNGASETTLASTESITVGTEYWVYVAWSGTSVWVGIDANALASGTRNAPQNNWGTTDLVVGTTAGSAGFGDLLIADRPLLPAERGAVRARSPISMGVLAGAPYRHFQLRPY